MSWTIPGSSSSILTRCSALSSIIRRAPWSPSSFDKASKWFRWKITGWPGWPPCIGTMMGDGLDVCLKHRVSVLRVSARWNGISAKQMAAPDQSLTWSMPWANECPMPKCALGAWVTLMAGSSLVSISVTAGSMPRSTTQTESKWWSAWRTVAEMTDSPLGSCAWRLSEPKRRLWPPARMSAPGLLKG